MKFVIEVDVDEKMVCEAAGTNDVEAAVKVETGWMRNSGIFVTSVKTKRMAERGEGKIMEVLLPETAA